MNKLHSRVLKIEKQINEIYEKVLEKRPSHFRKRDIINAFFGSLIFGLTFIFKGNLIQIALTLTTQHLWTIVIITSLCLTGEIYFIGYTRVKDKVERPFGQFWCKRFVTLYGIEMLVSLGLVYLFNMNMIIANNPLAILQLVVAVSMPCAVGAAIPGLLKQY